MARIKAEKRQKDQVSETHLLRYQAFMLVFLTGKKAENLREQKTFGKCSSRTEKSCLCRWPIAEVNLHDQLHSWHLNVSLKTSSWIREKLFLKELYSPQASGCRNFEEAGLFWEVWEDP